MDPVTVAVVMVAVFLFIFAGFSWRHHRKMRAFLLSPIQVSKDIRDKAGRFVGLDDGVIATLSIFDIIYTTVKTNAELVGNFLYLDPTQHISSLHDLMNVVGTSSGADAAHSLLDSAHSGIDFAPHIDMGIYSPAEATALFGDHPSVAVDSVLSGHDLVHLAPGIDSSHMSTEDLLHLHVHIPIIAVAVKSVKNFKKYYENRITIEEAFGETIVDGTLIGGGGLVGSTLGTKAGLLLAPMTGGVSLVLGPIIGGLLGLLAGKFAGHGLKFWFYGGDYKRAKKRYESMVEVLNRAAQALGQYFVTNYQRVKARLKHIHGMNIGVIRQKAEVAEPMLKRIFFPSAFSKSLQMSIAELGQEFRSETLPFYSRLKQEVAKLPGSQGGLLLYAQGRERLLKIDTLEKLYDSVTQHIAATQSARQDLEREAVLLNRKLGK